MFPLLKTCIGEVCVNWLIPSDVYMRWQNRPSLVQIMACCLFGAEPLSEPMVAFCQVGPLGTNFSEILIRIQAFSFKKIRSKMSSAKWHPFCLGPNVLSYQLVITCITKLLATNRMNVKRSITALIWVWYFAQLYAIQIDENSQKVALGGVLINLDWVKHICVSVLDFHRFR